MQAAIYTALCPLMALVLTVCAAVDHRDGAHCYLELAAGAVMSAACLAAVTFMGVV